MSTQGMSDRIRIVRVVTGKASCRFVDATPTVDISYEGTFGLMFINLVIAVEICSVDCAQVVGRVNQCALVRLFVSLFLKPPSDWMRVANTDMLLILESNLLHFLPTDSMPLYSISRFPLSEIRTNAGTSEHHIASTLSRLRMANEPIP